MEQHRLNSLAIICIEQTYGNQVIVNSIDKMIDIFRQRHGRKNIFFQYVLDDIETVDRIKYASYFSNDSRFISWENGERLRLHPDFNYHPFGYCVIFSSKKVTAPPPPPPSPKVSIRLCLTVTSINNIYTGEF